MKTPFFILCAATFLGTASAAHSQGLLALGQSADYEENVPFTYILHVAGGYDRIEYSGLSDQLDDVESYFIQTGVGVLYGNNDRVTKFNVGAEFSTIYYLDSAERDEDLFYNARLTFNISHEVSRRLTIGNNFYAVYEIEPDYGAGITTGRRDGQYIYGYNNTSIAYAWTERLATTSGYTIDGVHYVDDDLLAKMEDRLSHTFSQQVSYALSRTTKLTAEYRYKITNYDSPPSEIEGQDIINPDFTSHYVLAGIDQAWSDRLSASVRAGAQFYQSDRKDDTAPYIEASLNYAVSRQTNVRFYGQAGFDGSELGLYDSRYAYRTGVVASHQFTQRLKGQTGVHYVHSEFDGNELVDSANENQINASLGFSYNFWQNLSLDANYSYTTLTSDIDSRDYDRHRVNLGLNATF